MSIARYNIENNFTECFSPLGVLEKMILFAIWW
jgi:hypothetical protein